MFTYCLVTKGRREYLPSTLESLGIALRNNDVNVIIVDNGCPPDVSISLQNWCNEFGIRANYLRFDKNETAAPRIWDALRKFDVEWISFPGDDDLVEPIFLETLRERISRNPDLIAIAGGMRIMDSSGTQTGEVRRPAEFNGKVSYFLAGALSEPPFSFPALFFKLNSIAGILPPSRYVFDWWLALNLICTGDFATTDECAIYYRVHGDQESFLAPARRKYFEAQLILSRFIDSSVFEELLRKCNDHELDLFWERIKNEGPIYQDHEFGDYLKTSIGIKLADMSKDENLVNQILGDLAIGKGVLLRKGEVRSLSSNLEKLKFDTKANFQLTVADQNCTKLSKLILKSEIEFQGVKNFKIGCSHSKNIFDFQINCEDKYVDFDSWTDRLIVDITLDLERMGDLAFKVSPTEAKILSLMRRLKGNVPIRTIGLLKRYVSLRGRSS